MNKCIVCKSNENNKIYANLSQCKICKHIYSNTKLDKIQIKHIYDDNYFFGNQYYNYLEDKNIIEKNANLRLKKILLNKKNLKELKLLEIGSAYGFFLNYVNSLFKKVKGFEINQKAANYAHKYFKLDVSNEYFLEHNFYDEKFDIFCLWDVIEHLQNPAEYLKKFNNISNNHSLIAITTGDIKSFNARFNKEKWRLIQPPEHLHYFSKDTITRLLNDNGFEIIHFEYCGYYRSFLFICNGFNFFKKYFSWFLDFYRFLKLPNISIYLNFFDIMYIIARKID